MSVFFACKLRFSRGFAVSTRRGAAVFLAWGTVLAALSTEALSAPSDCIEQGGLAVCSAPNVGAWSYGLCDEAGTFVSRYRAWCEVRGGTYLGVNEGCRGDTPDTETTLYSRSLAFSHKIHEPRSCTGTDTGWGQTVSSSLCWSGGPTYQNGILTIDYRTMRFSCGDTGETIRAGRWRALTCPAGTQERTVGTQTVCVHPVDATCPVGNPIHPATGRKVQTERDWTFEGVDFERFYSSTGSITQYAAAGLTPTIDTVWRHTFDVRLQPVIANGFVVAAVSWPDGRIQYFRSNGSAVLPTPDNNSRLQTTAGGTIVRHADTAYRFSNSGNLVAMTTAAGLTFSMRYADGTLGSGGQAAVDSAGVLLPAPVPAGQLIEVVSSHGRRLRFDRDAAGRLTQIWPPGAVTPVRYAYGADENLSRVTYPDLSAREYVYNEPAFTSGANLPKALTGVFNAGLGLGTQRFATYTYNSLGQAVSTEHAGGVYRYLLSAAGNGTSSNVQTPNGSIRTHWLANVGGVWRTAGQSQPGGSGCAASTSAQSYDGNGNTVSRDDFNGNRTCMTNDLGRNLETSRIEGLTSSTSCATAPPVGAGLPPNARRISTQWHPDWPLRTRMAEPGRVTTYVYNGQFDPYAAGAIANCAPAAAVLPDGKRIAVLCRHVEQATTDANGALGFAAGAEVGVPTREHRWTYNEAGLVLTHDGPRTDVADITTNQYYSSTSFTGGDPNAAGYTKGDLQQTTNAAGHTTRYTKYNKLGLVLEMVDPNGVITQNNYDARQRLSSTTVAGLVTSYSYTATGLVKRVTQADQSWVQHDHDPAQRLVRLTDHLGNSISYTLDAAGNRTAEEVRDPSNQLRRVLTRSFDALGRVQQLTGREQAP